MKLFFSVFLSVFGGFHVLEAQDKQLQNRADSLLRRGNYAEAIPLYDKLLTAGVNTEDLYRSRGYCRMVSKQHALAKEDYLSALRINPKCYKCLCNLGRNEAFNNNMKGAIQWLDSAIRMEPKNDYAFHLRGQCKEQSADKMGALMDYNKSIELAPASAENYTARARYHMRYGMPALASRDLDKAIAVDSNYAFARYIRAQQRMENKDLTNALTDIKKCTEQNPNDPESLEMQGNIQSELGLFEDAEKSYNQSIALDAKRQSAYLNRSVVRYRKEDMEGSCDDLLTAQKLSASLPPDIDVQVYLDRNLSELCNPEKRSYWYQRGIASFNLKQYETAINYYNQGLKLFPNSPMILAFRGNAYKALNKDSQALDDYSNCFLYRTRLLGEIQESSKYKNDAHAAAMYQKGLIADVYSIVAEILATQGKYEAAISMADSSIQLLPVAGIDPGVEEMRAAHFNVRGVIFRSLGAWEQAKMDFIVAASIQQKNPLPHLNTALTILAQQSETPGRVAQITLKYNQNSMQNVSFSLPPFTWKKTNRNELMYALNECTSAIEIDPNFAPAYLVRAQVKMLLQLDDYCTDIWKARDLGIPDAEAQLKAKCK